MSQTHAVSSWFSLRVQRWLARNLPAVSSITLNRRNIFIIPTSYGFLFIAAIALIFVTAINYVLSLAFGLAFLMVSLFLVSILHTFRNLQSLIVQATGAEPVFAGQDASFGVLLKRSNGRQHEALELFFSGGISTHVDLLEFEQTRVNVYLPTQKRGYLKAPRLLIQTRFPLGLLVAWSRPFLDMSCLVYPVPIPGPLPAGTATSPAGTASSTHPGAEDFHGLRSYQPGDSFKQVAWRNLARGQGMLVKQFVDNADDRLILDWSMFAGFTAEERLSRLCYWVLTLSRGELEYGLRIPGAELAPGRGDHHRDHLLRTLALWSMDGREVDAAGAPS